MSVWVWILIVAIVLVLAGAAALAESRRRRARTEHLQEQFGPEYTNIIGEAEDKRAAESELSNARAAARSWTSSFRLRPSRVSVSVERWHEVQERFVDDPGGAVDDADRLVQLVMVECGYPTDDFEQRAADISVDHPEVVANYRAAHAVHDSNRKGAATTEELRHAFVGYRALFDELLGVPVAATHCGTAAADRLGERWHGGAGCDGAGREAGFTTAPRPVAPSPIGRRSSAFAPSPSRLRGTTSGSRRAHGRSCRQQASMPPGGASTSTTRRFATRRTGRSSTA